MAFGALLSVTLTDGRTSRMIECDILCAAFGLLPNVELARFAGCAIGTDGVQVNDEQATSVGGIFCVGEPTGIGGVDLSLVEGEIGGTAAAGGPPSRRLMATRARLRREATLLAETFALRPEPASRTTTRSRAAARTCGSASSIVRGPFGRRSSTHESAWAPAKAESAPPR
jgi:hypothetical protein